MSALPVCAKFISAVSFGVTQDRMQNGISVLAATRGGGGLLWRMAAKTGTLVA